MWNRSRKHIAQVARISAFVMCCVAVSRAQFPGNEFQLPDGLNQFVTGGKSEVGLQVSSEVVMSSDRYGLLTVTLRMNPGWKVYSLTQRPGGPPPTKIHIKPSSKFQLAGSFAPKYPPKSEHSDVFEMDIETLSDSVSWVVPIDVAVPTAELAVSGYIEGLACFGQCIPFGEQSASFVTTSNLTKRVFIPKARVPGSHADIMGQLSVGTSQPGDTVQLLISIRPDPDWHIYAYDTAPASMFQKPLLTYT